jgi:pyruvate/2-oxoglutarate dehydrogenase complex dihydrolipoamide dehydrogenase (E3) component
MSIVRRGLGRRMVQEAADHLLQVVAQMLGMEVEAEERLAHLQIRHPTVGKRRNL